MTASKFHLTRRQLLAGASALPLFSIATRPAHAAEFSYKFATGQDPSHPVNKRAQEAIDRIRNATNGRLRLGAGSGDAGGSVPQQRAARHLPV